MARCWWAPVTPGRGRVPLSVTEPGATGKMLVFAGCRCYNSQVTAAVLIRTYYHARSRGRVAEGRRNAGKEEVIEEIDRQAIDRQACRPTVGLAANRAWAASRSPVR